MEVIKQTSMDPNDIMISFDVKSLFTKVPVKEAIDIVCYKLSDDDSLSQRTSLSVTSIRQLMKLCFDGTYFLWQGEIYSQKSGAPMGLSLSVCLANAYMENFESTAIASSENTLKLWKRYVDDIFVIWQHGDDEVNHFFHHIKSIHPNIQFILEGETNGKLPF